MPRNLFGTGNLLIFTLVLGAVCNLHFVAYGVEPPTGAGDAWRRAQQRIAVSLTNRPMPQQLDAYLSTLDAQQKNLTIQQLITEWNQMMMYAQKSGDKAMVDYLNSVGAVIKNHMGGMMPNNGMMQNGGMQNTGGITPQQLDAMLSSASEQDRNLMIEDFWRTVFLTGVLLRSDTFMLRASRDLPAHLRIRLQNDVKRNQSFMNYLFSLDSVIRKHDRSYQQHRMDTDNRIRIESQKLLNGGNSGGSGMITNGGSGSNPNDRPKCGICRGSGKCERCHGEGKYLLPGGTTWIGCDWCTDGRCRYCWGTGFQTNRIPLPRPRSTVTPGYR